MVYQPTPHQTPVHHPHWLYGLVSLSLFLQIREAVAEMRVCISGFGGGESILGED